MNIPLPSTRIRRSTAGVLSIRLDKTISKIEMLLKKWSFLGTSKFNKSHVAAYIRWHSPKIARFIAGEAQREDSSGYLPRLYLFCAKMRRMLSSILSF